MPRKYSVKITRRAESDIEGIYDYIYRDRPQAAGAFVAELERQISSLERYPRRCSVVPEAEELGIQYRHLVYGEYRTLFRVTDKTVYILRVIHGARLLDIDILK